MSEKERLIELLKQTNGAIYWDSSDKDFIDKVADHLLANGVIVPPCKVGDVVYKITPNGLFIKDYEVVGFHLGDFLTLRGHKRKPYLVSYDRTSRYLKHITLDEIGKTAFLTREEAEAALKGGAE